ncbi:unnamed protein product [Clavelina lepadiformis]|uniref:Protein-PII uridylyltransferase N-terminal domain-containing protein n=1 Tax=Clavelina lepadiformis TaxID=159417 RepID=A0ABP0GI80_CLALP
MHMLSSVAFISEVCHYVSFALKIKASKAEELELATKLKTDLCDENGREKAPFKCAEIFHKMGVIYMNRANLTRDKLCFIQSATLLNAAIVRDPTNKAKVEEDLQTLCLYLLKSANAEDDQADLLLETKWVKEMVDKMREKTKDELKLLNNIPDEAEADELRQLEEAKIKDVQTLQNNITNDFKALMAELAEFCVHVLGELPCDYALVGMGSLARVEVTPYSDFENLIVLQEGVQNWPNYESILEHYRWFAVIFQVVIINLGETIIPSVIIPSLNDFNSPNGNWFWDKNTRHGISFDAFYPFASNVPLGRVIKTKNKSHTTELIKPVSAMIHYLDSEEDARNGYNLADILSRNCYVAGNVALYEEFDKQVKIKLSAEQNKSAIVSKLYEYIKEDLEKFGIRNNLYYVSDADSCNIKVVVYRSTTIFISALGKLLDIRSPSCFEIVTELSEFGVTNDFARKLTYAVAVACEVRLKIYSRKEEQDNWINEKSLIMSDVGELSQTVGTKSLIDYFLIAYSLQYDIANYLSFSLKHFYENPEVLVAVLNYYFRRYKNAIRSGKFFIKNARANNNSTGAQHNHSCKSTLTCFGESYSRIQNHLDSIKHDEIPELCFERDIPLKDLADTLKIMCICLVRMEKYKEALFLNEQEIQLRRKLPGCEKSARDMAICLNGRGVVLNGLGNYEQSLLKVKESFNLITSLEYAGKKQDLVVLYHTIGHLCNAQHQSDEAIVALREGLRLQREMAPNALAMRYLSRFHQAIGLAYFNKQKFKRALSQYEISLNTQKQISQDETRDELVADIYSNMAPCLKSMGDPTGEKQLFEKELTIRENVLAVQMEDFYHAGCFERKGVCLDNLQRHDDAMECYKSALSIRKWISSDDKPTALLHWRFGSSLHQAKRWVEALNQLKNGLEILKLLLPEQTSTDDVGSIHNEIGICLENLNRMEEALNHYQLAIRIKTALSQVTAKDKNIAAIYDNIGRCLRNMQRFEEALEVCEKSLQIRNLASLDKSKDKDVANSLYEISLCFTGLYEFEKALNNGLLHLKIIKQISKHQTRDAALAAAFYNVGSSFYDLEKYEDALENLLKALRIKTEISLDATLDGDVANTHRFVGMCLACLGRLAEAIQYFDLAIHAKTQSSDNEDLISLLYNKAECLNLADRTAESERVYEEILTYNLSDRKANGETALLLYNCGAYLVRHLRHEEALQYFQSSFETRKKLQQEDSAYVANIYHSIGSCLQSMGRINEAGKYFRQALNISRTKNFDKVDQKNFIASLHQIACSLFKGDQYEEALHHFTSALKMRKELVGVDKDTCIISGNVGECLLYLERFTEALEYFQQGLEMCKEVDAAMLEDELVKKITSAISFCRSKLNTDSPLSISICGKT